MIHNNQLRGHSINLGTQLDSCHPGTCFPVVIQHTNIHKLKLHPDYKLAKSGNSIAALNVIRDIVKPEKIAMILEGNKNAIIAPVLAAEESGNNKLPLAYATKLAMSGSGKISKIFQTNKTFHTGSNALHRILTTPNFTGKVAKGQPYIIVDDVVTSGSTVRALKEYIETNGGYVVLISSLANASNPQTGWGGHFIIEPSVCDCIETKFDTNNLNILLSQYQIANSYKQLTNGQAKYILCFKGINELRTKLNDSGLRTIHGNNGNTIHGNYRF